MIFLQLLILSKSHDLITQRGRYLRLRTAIASLRHIVSMPLLETLLRCPQPERTWENQNQEPIMQHHFQPRSQGLCRRGGRKERLWELHSNSPSVESRSGRVTLLRNLHCDDPGKSTCWPEFKSKHVKHTVT